MSTKLANGSFTGLKKMLFENTIHFSSKLENMVPEGEQFFEISLPVNTEKVHFGGFISYPRPQNADSLAFLQHSLNIVFSILVGFLLVSVIIVCFQAIAAKLNQNNKRNNKRNRICLNLLRLINFGNCSRSFHLTKLNLIMAFYLLFFQIHLNMIKSKFLENEQFVNIN